MASMISSALRSSSRRLLHPAHAWRVAAERGIASTSRACEAHNFAMPALSPTMTEGSIASWKINEGEKFSAGDVLLEIETDKAQMDVEAQDDGVLAKIFIQASKDPIKVGTRIGIIADPDDDISSLEFPPDVSPSPPKEESAPSPSESTTKADSTKPATSQDDVTKPPKDSSVKAVTEHESPTKARKNPFVASPGLTHILHSNGLEMSDVKGTGPGGRVLKGDVLAHIGKIGKEKPINLASEIAKMAKLDLSNIKPKKVESKKEKAAKEDGNKVEKPVEVPTELVLTVQVSFTEVMAVQRRLQDSVKVNIPLSSFIAHAVARANQNLPPSRLPPTSSELYDQILGTSSTLKKQPLYIPKLSTEVATPILPKAVLAVDIFDVITGKVNARTPAVSSSIVKDGPSKTVNVLRLTVAKEDEKRGAAFLARLKSALEETPEDLVA